MQILHRQTRQHVRLLTELCLYPFQIQSSPLFGPEAGA